MAVPHNVQTRSFHWVHRSRRERVDRRSVRARHPAAVPRVTRTIWTWNWSSSTKRCHWKRPQPRNIIDPPHSPARCQWVIVDIFSRQSGSNPNAYNSLAESGIIADILTSPESETSLQDGSAWPSIYTKNKTKITQRHSVPNQNVHKTPSDDTDLHNSNINPYVNNDSLAVHL